MKKSLLPKPNIQACKAGIVEIALSRMTSAFETKT